MFKQRTFWASMIVLVVLATLHFLGAKYYWYWIYKWFDIPMHILGGAWLALTAFWLSSYFSLAGNVSNYKIRAFWIMIFAVSSIGIFWEIFELVGGITNLTDIGYWPDTIGDIINDFVGGFIAYFYFIKRRKCADGVTFCEPDSIKLFPR